MGIHLHQFIVTTLIAQHDVPVYLNILSLTSALSDGPMRSSNTKKHKKNIYLKDMNNINITVEVLLPAQVKTRTLTPIPQKYPHRA